MTDILRDLSIKLPEGRLLGQLSRPQYATQLVIMPRTASGPTHIDVGVGLAARNIATLNIELLTVREVHFPDMAHNIPLLTERLTDVLDFIRRDGDTEDLALGLYAADHVTPAALRATALRDQDVRALVVDNGFIDYAGLEYLQALAAPLLVLIDVENIAAANATRRAFEHLQAPHELRLIEPHEAMAEATAWFEHWLVKPLPTTT